MKFRILKYDTVESTNTLARSLAESGVSEGTVVTADYQTRGRGRFKRRWTSPRGKNLLFSLVLRPKVSAMSAAMITHLAARAVQDVLKDEFQIPATLKRPNDVLVKHKKIAGILTEASAHHDRISYVVVGIGLNVNSKAASIPKRATSIACETKKTNDVDKVLESVLIHFRKRYREFLKV